VDLAGYRYLWPGEPLEVGRTFEMNDHRAIIVGICKASPTFQTFPIAYTRYSQAVRFVPPERRVLTFVLAQGDPGVPATELCQRIKDQTGLQAVGREAFSAMTISYYMRRTGIPVNFGITVALGFIIGAAIAGQTFYLFTLDNLRQFGALKAMGVTNGRLVLMVLFQGLVVGVVGYGLGMGLAAGFEEVLRATITHIPPAFYMAWWIPFGTAVAVTLIMSAATLVSLRRVMVLEPAAVFR
jgi:putative ABC transport system permease protein